MDAQGKGKWTFWTYAGIASTFGMADVDGDGWKEILAGNGVISSTDTLWALKDDGKFLERYAYDGWGGTVSALATADLTGDGKKELVVGTQYSNIRALAAAPKKKLWAHRLGGDVKGILALDGPPPMIVAGSQSGFVCAFDAQGGKRWGDTRWRARGVHGAGRPP